MSPQALTYLAFDYGLRRVGVATGNSLMRQAQALRTIAAEGDARFAQIGALIQEWRPDALVVGVPFHPDGAPHENTARARKFIGQLRGRFRLTVHEIDERYSTTEAIANGARDLDAASAAILLQQFFDDHRGAPGGTPQEAIHGAPSSDNALRSGPCGDLPGTPQPKEDSSL